MNVFVNGKEETYRQVAQGLDALTEALQGGSVPASTVAQGTITTGSPLYSKDGSGDDKKGLPWWAWVGISLGTTAVLGGFIYFMRRRNESVAQPSFLGAEVEIESMPPMIEMKQNRRKKKSKAKGKR